MLMKARFNKFLILLTALILGFGQVWATSYIPGDRKVVTADETIDYATIAGANATTSGKWIVNPRGGTTSGKKYTNLTTDTKGNPDGIVDNIATITSNVNMATIQVPSTAKYNQNGKYVIHMRITGITGIIAHGVTGSSGRGCAIYGQEYSTSLTENTEYGSALASMTRSGNSGSFLLQYTGFTASKEYLITIAATGGDDQLYAIELIAGSVTKHTVTYDLNGATGTTPTQADVAEGAKFTLHDGTTGITAPTDKKFDGWHDGTTKYAGGAEYTMGTSDVTLTAQWVDDLPDPTVTFADGTYIIGGAALNMSDNFSSNSSGSVTYALKEASANASITAAGVFTATAEGEYVVVATQVATAIYSAISKEATVTVLDNEISDTYVWKKNSGYTGCVSSPNADAPAAKYTTVTVEGMASMTSGRASTANTTVTVTIAVTQEGFAIKNICTYGKLEEAEGAEISWDGGTNWTSLAAYSETKKDFAAPAGFPTSFKIKFVSASTSTGGLWWRNALVTLEVIKTVSTATEELLNVKVNGTDISAADLATLKSNKSLAIATSYATAPTVTFIKRTTTTYEGGWPSSQVDTEEEVAATDATTNWSATSSAINAQTYTVTLAKPAGPTLETEATAFTLTSAKIATDTKKFTFSGANLEGNVTIALESAVAGMTVSPAEVTPTAGAITDEEVTITYKSLADVAEANVNLIVRYSDDVKIIIPLTYSSTAGVEDLTPISAATTWDWNGAADAAFGTLGQNEMIVLANADITWVPGFNANAIAGKLQHYYRDGKYAQGNELKFNTTIPGKVFVTYSNTGGNPARTVNVNGTKGSLTTAGTGEKRTESFLVSAGDVLIKGVLVSDDSNQMLRFYEVRFAPVYSVTYSEGEGSIKSGESIPTQADEAAGEKITLAAADVLEKDSYDFVGWLCNVDGITYDAGDEYTMTAAATTFTAQWTLHVDPVDPTLTYDNGAYQTGAAALDLSTLITASESTGAITYSVKVDGGTNASIDGNNFTATAAGTATITASQAAVLGYNAITVDFDVVVTEATEIDGIKMVVAEALTGNFVSARTLSNGDNTIEGIAYTKYLTMSSTMTSFGNEVAPSATKGIYYYPSHKNIRFYFYVNNNQSSAKKIYIYTVDEDAESTSDATSANVSVDAGRHMVYADVVLTKHAAVVFGVENTGTQICQIVAVESGDALLQGGEIGYTIDYNKCYISPKANAVAVYDGIEYKLSNDAKLVSAGNVQLTTLGTHYIKFHLENPAQVKVCADNHTYYVGSECSTSDDAKLYEASGDGEFALAAGDWYINGSGTTVKINKLEFSAPKCEQPTITTQPATKIDFPAGDMTATVVAEVSDGGTLSYQWYDASDDSEVAGATTATLTTATEGTYYVIVTNSLADHADNFIKSDNATLGYIDLTDATLSALSYGGTSITLSDGVYEYDVNLAEGTVDVPLLAATATMAAYGATAVPTDAVAFVSYEATSTVLVTAADGITQQTYTVNFHVNHTILALVDVTGDMTWDFSKANDGSAAGSNLCNEEIFANVAGIVNNSDFESDNLFVTANKFKSGKLQASMLKFHTTVDGMITVVFSNTGSKSSDRYLTVNGRKTDKGSKSEDAVTYTGFVYAGDVVLGVVEGDGTMLNFTSVDFKATTDHTRTGLNPKNIGTLCWTNDAILGGATLYELNGKNEHKYLVFDEVVENRIEKGKPYIFVPKNGNTEIKIYNTSEAALTNDDLEVVNGMKGTFVRLSTVDDGENSELWNKYIFKDNKYIFVDANNCNLGAYRAYIVSLDDIAAATPPSNTPNGMPRQRLTVGGPDNLPTGIDDLNVGDQPMKVMINGQLFILRGDKMFDATGRIVK